MTESSLAAARLVNRLERLSRIGDAPDPLNPAQWEALRYLARANRFSRTPAALADFFGSTRGTVSRTLASLESKALVARRPSPRDGRSVEFSLTPQAHALLARDPQLELSRLIETALGAQADALDNLLRRVLSTAVARNGSRAFGVCADCRHFRAGGGAEAPHRCALLNEPLSEADSRRICVEQTPAA